MRTFDLSRAHRAHAAHRLGCIVCAGILLLQASHWASAIVVTLDYLEALDGNTPNGVYSSPSGGASTWDSELSVLNAGESAPSVVGASATAKARYAFSQTSASPNSSTNSLTTTSHFRAAFTVANDDPLNNVIYNIQFVSVLAGGVTTTIQDTRGSWELLGPIGRVTYRDASGYGVSSPDTFGGGSGGPGAPFHQGGQSGPFSTTIQNERNLTGTDTYTIELNTTLFTSVNGVADIVLLAGRNTHLNPLIGSDQDYPIGTDPANDGLFLSLTATIVALPEPSTLALGLLGALGAYFLARRRRR